MKAYKKKEVILKKRRQKYLGTSSRNQPSPQLIEMGQLRDYEQT